jgi:DNA-binding transcriptional MerR regulator
MQAMNSAQDDLLLAHEVAKLASPPVAVITARRWADTGRIPTTRTASSIRLYRRADVLHFLSDRAAKAAARKEAKRA